MEEFSIFCESGTNVYRSGLKDTHDLSYFNKELKSYLETVNYIFYHYNIFHNRWSAAMIAWQATIKLKVRFIFLQIKSNPAQFHSVSAIRRESVDVNEAFCDHYTLILNNRNETTAASGDSAKTFAPPGFGRRSQLPSRVRRESGPCASLFGRYLRFCIDPG